MALASCREGGLPLVGGMGFGAWFGADRRCLGDRLVVVQVVG